MVTPDDDAAASRLVQSTATQADGMLRLNEDTIKVIGLLNRDIHPEGINQFETLRRMVRDNAKLKDIYRGVVNPSKVVLDAVQVFVKRAGSEAGLAGGTRLEDVLREASAQKVLDEIVKDILPAVISSHIQDYMAGERTRLR